MTKIIPQNFLTLSVSMKALSESEIIAKYPEEIATKILDAKNNIEDLTMNNNAKFAIRIDHYHYITKKKEEATPLIKIDSAADASVKIIKELKDPNNTHKYTAKQCIISIKERLIKDKTTIFYNGREVKFTSFHFNNFCKYYGLKENERFCYVHRHFSAPQYSYSQQAIDFIVTEIEKDPENILNNIKKS
ncbi:MAG: hypothetical protein LUF92_01230 [Clostridiales bacterium]|nr:hypothetical protein [Clostridiales bacterium]